MSQHVKYLVVDSGAFIKNSPVHEYAENIFTVDGAVKEIKDKATLLRLQVLPYTLHVKEPSVEAYKHVLEFSKKTGDYNSLSTVDLKVAALTYQLQREHAPTEPVNEQPSSTQITKKPVFESGLPLGFYYPKKKKSSMSESSEQEETDSVEEEEVKEDEEMKYSKEAEDKGVDEVEEEEEEEDDDDDEGWITANDIQEQLDALELESKAHVTVACVTTDFAVQNVLLQMGLHVVSVDGMLIKQTRVFILRCYSCYKTTNDTTKVFCSNCGNKTLKRVAVSVNEDGSKNIHINFRRPINLRGTRFSLPTPKGGRHAQNPVLCADQPTAKNRPKKTKTTDVYAADYEVHSSPFAVNDVYSRSAILGIRNKTLPQHSRRNPNEWTVKTGNKKERKKK